MRNILCSLLFIFCSSAYADHVILLYEPDVSREEMELKITSFGLTAASYWESIHGGLAIVPCREAERWVRVLNQVKGVLIAEHDAILTVASISPSSVPTCIPKTEATFDEETETLTIPQLYLDGKVYRAELASPFNVQDLELIGVLDIYQYE